MHNILFAVKFDNLSVYSSLSLMKIYMHPKTKKDTVTKRSSQNVSLSDEQI